jgi:hypothetical protein
MNARSSDNIRLQRRQFLTQLSALAALGAGASAQAADAPQPAATAPLPTVSLGSYRVSRLVAGWNPIGGHSYQGPHMDQHMREYFTPEKAAEFLLDCERAGMNTHQFSPGDKAEAMLRLAREQGCKMNFICLHSGRDGIQQMVQRTAPMALAHHGGVTDRLFSEGKHGEVRDYLKAVHDSGLLAGVSAHNPDCIQRAADEGWEADFFMTCFYFVTRKMFPGHADPETLEIAAYPFYRSDPQVMIRVVRQVKQPCLCFKILGGGRMCRNQETVREAFRLAFAGIKPSDAVIVGMYPRFFDEIGANAQYTGQYGQVRVAAATG